MQRRDFFAGLHAQLGVQIGKGFIEQKDVRVSDERAAKRNPLHLATRELARFSLEQGIKTEARRRAAHTTIDLVFRFSAHAKTKRHVVVDGLLRIERVVLEYHRNIAIFRRKRGHVPPADHDLARCHIIEAGKHAQGGRFPAAGRPDKNDQLSVGNIQRKILHRPWPSVSAKGFRYILESDSRHTANLASRCL
ncbi:hypothetical protein HNQ36_003637 [Afipia massiliensis]|uniref:Uncharacterized protein n=1 Tax=Afipia massiliensis TaxID=211460 RepID=A0A840N504_9BRAD|nr:hypothetical protein [Afipia massiliensis]